MESERIIIKMIKTARPDLSMFFKIDPATVAEIGKEYNATSNPNGAICAICANGEQLGIKPGEFEFVEAPEWLIKIHAGIIKKLKFRCEAQIMIEKEFIAEDEEMAEKMMDDYMMEEFADLDWIISAYKGE